MTSQRSAKRRVYAFGHPKGHPIGSIFPDRSSLNDNMIHGPTQAGIHGHREHGAYSIVMSGGYEDDEDHGTWFWYTGEGGRGTDGVGPQVKDQSWSDKGNRALKMSFHQHRPVRVIRGHVRDSPYGPAEGFRYDGLYTVEKLKTEKGKSGFKVCKALFKRREDQDPLPSPRWQVPNDDDDIEIPSDSDNGAPSDSDSDSASSSGYDAHSDFEIGPVQRAAPLVASSVTNVRKRNRLNDSNVARKIHKPSPIDHTCTLPEKSSVSGRKKLSNLPKIKKNK